MNAVAKPPRITRFKGLNNVADPLNLGIDWLTVADNVAVEPGGGLEVREGYQPTEITDALTSAFATRDERRLYVAGSDLLAVHPDLSTTALLELQAGRMYWCEVNGQVFFNNGSDSGTITEDHEVLPWAWPAPTAPTMRPVSGNLPAGLYRAACTFSMPDGRETGASYINELELTAPGAIELDDIPQVDGWITNVYLAPAHSTILQRAFSTQLTATVWNRQPHELGSELRSDNLLPLPSGCGAIELYDGRMLAARYHPAENITAIWRSQPLAFHLFDAQDIIIIKGHVLAMADAGEALLIGTDTEIHALTGEGVRRLADYGLVPGWPIARDKDRRLLLWTARGVCTAMPFVNLTQDRISVPPGLQVGATVINANGQERFIALLHAGGAAFNHRNPS